MLINRSLPSPRLRYAALLAGLYSFSVWGAVDNPDNEQSNDAQAEDSQISEVIVTADFRPLSLQQSPLSVTVLGEDAIEARAAQHLEELLGMAPNVNFSSGASRARFYQIRGIGERSEYAQAINPSVGLLIDGVDFSGLGTVASSFDLEQIEILRGPQGTRYGANALAGMINIISRAPEDEFGAELEATVADYNSRGLGVALNAPLIEERWLSRLSLQQYRSDGFIKNAYLDRKNTNNRDEFNGRLRSRVLVSDDLTIDFSWLHADYDNGYDAFSLDNNRTTLSDQPGHDRQRSNALIAKSIWDMNDALRMEVLLSGVDASTEYSYDEDWSYEGIAPGWEYKSYDDYRREINNRSIDLRLMSNDKGKLFAGSTDWVIGVYAIDKDNDLLRLYTYNSGPFRSELESTNRAVYGRLDIALHQQLTLVAGLRADEWEADYASNDGVTPDSQRDSELGGRISLNYQALDDYILYLSASRGIKPGGFNTDSRFVTEPELAQYQSFDYETLSSYEWGIKARLNDGRMQARAALFYAERDNMQVKGSIVRPRTDGPGFEFIDYISNAASGRNVGAEGELEWYARDNLKIFASAGLLATEIDNFITSDGDNQDGRDQAHAPNYQGDAGFEFGAMQGWYLRADVEAKDEFYFSDRHDEKSDSYVLFNARIGYRTEQWRLALWARNLSDEDYAVRGFAFANDPRDEYASGGYQQLGEPRMVGMTLNLML